MLTSARPYTNDTVSSSFDHVAVLYLDPFNRRGPWRTLIDVDTWSTIPLSALGLIVHLDYIFAGGADNAASIEHHRSDRLIVCESIVNTASAEIPNLQEHISLEND